jgi:hypothetical protein
MVFFGKVVEPRVLPMAAGDLRRELLENWGESIWPKSAENRDAFRTERAGRMIEGQF